MPCSIPASCAQHEHTWCKFHTERDLNRLGSVQKYIFQPGYEGLSAADKTSLLELGICPPNNVLQDCGDLKMNFQIDWLELKLALLVAVHDMQASHRHFLDGIRSN